MSIKHILYVEDSHADADLTRRALARQVPDLELELVLSVAAGQERLARAPLPDLLLSDLRLPDGSGLELLAWVRERRLPLAVVILTGSGDSTSAVAALKAGADDYLIKREDYLERLPQTLVAALERFHTEAERRTCPLRVLYAEHNRFDVDLTRRHLEQHTPHIRLEAVPDAAAVLERLPGGRPPGWDVVLLDYRLPGLDALEVTKMLRQQRGLDLAIVLVTGQGSEEVAAAALRLGVTDYLGKHPGYLHELPAVLEKAHRQVELDRERAALRATTARLNHLLATNPTILYSLRVEGETMFPVWVSENVERILGFSIEEALRPGWWWSHVHPDDRPRVAAANAALLLKDSLVHSYRFLNRDGRVLWVRDELRLLRDAMGRPQEVVGAWADITEQHQSEERMRLDAAAIESTRDGVTITDLNARIIAVNRAFTEVTGYTELEVLGKNPRILRSGRQDRAFYQAMWASLRSTGYWQGEIWNRRKNGEVYPEWLSISTVRNERGEPTHYVGVFTDISQLRQSEQRLEHLAYHDPLTDLPNRLLLQARLEHALELAQRRDARVGVLFLDLDQFKTVNDSLGHMAGDELLVAVARRLQSRLREEDTLARLGGDEFAVLLESIAEAREAAVVARDLLAALAHPFSLSGGQEIFVGASVGIGIYPEDGADGAELLRDADAALNRAKDNGRGQFCFYTGDMNAEALAKLELEAALRQALEREELVLYYQPKVDLGTGKISGAEALLRWRRNDALVPPMRFIPLAEKTGLIGPIGDWAIDAACRQMREWLNGGLKSPRVAVNVSARQFRSGNLPAVVSGALERHGLSADCLELELTETMLMERSDEAVRLLHALKAIGVKLSLDDFGTGYSSLSYLSRFPIDSLKIDRSFVQDVVTEPNAATIAASIIGLGRRMGLRVVAEGVETEPQLGYLRMNGCDEMQGYLFSKPLPADGYGQLLEEGRCIPVAEREPESARTLLIVDDEPNILAALSRVLRAEGYRLLTASDACQALQTLACNQVQVVLSDQLMPGMNGTELLGRVKAMYPETVRIVLSGFTDLESVTRAVNEGAIYKFLTKPWNDEQLRAQLREAFQYHEAMIRPRARA